MPAYPFDMSVLRWNHPNHSGFFAPSGKPEEHAVTGARRNPAEFYGTNTLGARIIVGLKVGKKNRWKVADVIRIVRRVRTDQIDDPSSTFLAQKGIYKSVLDGSVVTEDGCQAFILCLDGSTKAQFLQQMTALCETVARELKQERVILELQRGGVSQGTWSVWA